MKTLYQAANSLEAHMIADLLRQQGLDARVDGEYLQGGVGELPAAGLVRVMIDEGHYAAGRAIIEQWEATQPAADAGPTHGEPAVRRSRIPPFLIGLLLGLGCAWYYYRSPVTTDGIDFNGDDVLDTRWHYARSGLPVRTELDRNLDGRVDSVMEHGRDGTLESSRDDNDFDGVFETHWFFRNDNPLRSETDTDGDGFPDLKTYFSHGVAQTAEYIYPGTGQPQRIEYFRLGKITHADRDTDLDGVMDTRTYYDAVGEVRAVERMD